MIVTRIATGDDAVTKMRIVTPTMTTMRLIVAVVAVAVVMTLTTRGMSGLARVALAMMMTIVMTIGLVVAPVVAMKRTTPTRIAPAVHGAVTRMTRTTIVVEEAGGAVTRMTRTKMTGVRRVVVTETVDVTKMRSADPGIGVVNVVGQVETTMMIEMIDGSPEDA